MIEPIAAAIDGTSLAAFAAGDAYPFINIAHLVGLVLLVGSVWIMDARVLGALATVPVEPLVRQLVPVAAAGLFLMLLTGPLLFAADARALAGNGLFRWKLVFVALAMANAMLFRLVWKPGQTSTAARAMAAVSAVIWLVVLWQGRMIAYS